MAKSIRSKIKRKHRAEFRRTHGNVRLNWKEQSFSLYPSKHLFLVVFVETFFVVSHHFILVLQDAYKINMAKVQANLADSIEKQSMKTESLEKLTKMLATDSEPLASGMDEDVGKAASAIAAVPEIDSRGENKVIVSKSSRGRKYSVRKAIHQKSAETNQATPKHRYHCAF